MQHKMLQSLLSQKTNNYIFHTVMFSIYDSLLYHIPICMSFRYFFFIKFRYILQLYIKKVGCSSASSFVRSCVTKMWRIWVEKVKKLKNRKMKFWTWRRPQKNVRLKSRLKIFFRSTSKTKVQIFFNFFRFFQIFFKIIFRLKKKNQIFSKLFSDFFSNLISDFFSKLFSDFFKKNPNFQIFFIYFFKIMFRFFSISSDFCKHYFHIFSTLFSVFVQI